MSTLSIALLCRAFEGLGFVSVSSGTEILPPEFCLLVSKFQNFTFLRGKILDLTKIFGRKQKQERGFDAKNQIFVITLWYFDFCCLLPTRPKNRSRFARPTARDSLDGLTGYGSKNRKRKSLKQ